MRNFILMYLGVVASQVSAHSPICSHYWFYARHQLCESSRHPPIYQENSAAVCGIASYSTTETWRDASCGVESYKTCRGRFLNWENLPIETHDRFEPRNRDINQCHLQAVDRAEKRKAIWLKKGLITSEDRVQLSVQDCTFRNMWKVHYSCCVHFQAQRPHYEMVQDSRCEVERYKSCSKPIYKTCRHEEFGSSGQHQKLRSPDCKLETLLVFNRYDPMLLQESLGEQILCSTCDELQSREKIECLLQHISLLRDADQKGKLQGSLKELLNPLVTETLIATKHPGLYEILEQVEASVLKHVIEGHLSALIKLPLSVYSRLLKAGWDVNRPDSDGRTPLIIALEERDELASILIEAGANVSQTDSKGRLPIVVARSQNLDSLAQLIAWKQAFHQRSVTHRCEIDPQTLLGFRQQLIKLEPSSPMAFRYADLLVCGLVEQAQNLNNSASHVSILLAEMRITKTDHPFLSKLVSELKKDSNTRLVSQALSEDLKGLSLPESIAYVTKLLQSASKDLKESSRLIFKQIDEIVTHRTPKNPSFQLLRAYLAIERLEGFVLRTLLEEMPPEEEFMPLKDHLHHRAQAAALAAQQAFKKARSLQTPVSESGLALVHELEALIQESRNSRLIEKVSDLAELVSLKLGAGRAVTNELARFYDQYAKEFVSDVSEIVKESQ